MYNPRENGREKVIAVAIDRDKGSQQALKWAVEFNVTRGQTVRLIHVLQRPPSNPNAVDNDVAFIEGQPDCQAMELFLPFRCFCMRRQVICEVVVLEDPDVAKALIEYVSQHGVETLLLGATSKNGLSRLFRTTDIPSSVLKWAPDFCNVYVISKGKLSIARSASRPVPHIAMAGGTPFAPIEAAPIMDALIKEMINLFKQIMVGLISLSRGGERMHDELSMLDNDMMSFSARPSTDSTFFNFYEDLGSGLIRNSSCRSSNVDRRNPESFLSGSRSPSDNNTLPEFSLISQDSGRKSWTAQDAGGMEDEMRRLRIELKQTMDMYHAACKEALAAKQKAMELQQWKMKEEQRLQKARLTEETASAIVEREKSKCKAAIETAEATQKIVELEIQKRVDAELKALTEAQEKKRGLDALGQSNIVLEYQSLYHILAVLFLFYFYFSLFK